MNFGDLRSLMQSPAAGEDWSTRLLHLLLGADRRHPEAFAARWAPYLAGFSEIWSERVVTLSDSAIATLGVDADLSRVADVLPDASFALSFGGVMLTHARLDRALETARSLRVERLDVDGVRFDARRIELLSQLTGAASPRVLRLVNTNIGRFDVRELGASGLFEHVEELDLTDSSMSDRAILSWMTAGRFPALRALTLDRNPVGDVAFEALVGSRSAPNLARVGMAMGSVSPGGMRAWTDATGRWTALDLAHSRLEGEGVLALANSARTAALTHLRLSGVSHSGANSSFAALVTSPHARQLEHLDVSRNGLGHVFGQAVGVTYDLRSLRVLDVGNNRIDARALAALLSSPSLRELSELRLSGCPIGARGVRVLADALEDLNPLSLLDLSRAFDASVETVRALALAPGFEHLRQLDLSRTGVTADALEALLASPLNHLERLGLAGDDLGADGLAALAVAGYEREPGEQGVWRRAPE